MPIDKTYKSRGLYTISGDKLDIRELPVGVWTDTYKEHLEKLSADKKNIRYYNSYCTDVDVHFEIFLGESLISTYDKSREKFEKTMKLNSTISCRNLVAFNSENKLVKYDNVLEMLEEYIGVRMNKYVERKVYMLEQLQKDIDLNEIKVRFITDFIEDRIKIIKKRKIEIVEQLEKRKYFKVEDSYDYLLRMPIYSLSLDKIDELTTKIDNLKESHTQLSSTSEHKLWMTDIGDLKLTKPKETKFTFKKKK